MVDVRTGKPIPFAQVVFVGTQIGAVVDTAGYFRVENRQGLVTLSAGIVGYKKRIITLHPNRITSNMRIELEPDVYNLGEVVITASRRFDVLLIILSFSATRKPSRQYRRCSSPGT